MKPRNSYSGTSELRLSPEFAESLTDLAIEAGIASDNDVSTIKRSLSSYVSEHPPLRQALIEGVTRALADPAYLELVLNHLDRHSPDLLDDGEIADDLSTRLMQEGPAELNDGELGWLALSSEQLQIFSDKLDDGATDFWLKAMDDAFATSALERGESRLSFEELRRNVLFSAAEKQDDLNHSLPSSPIESDLVEPSRGTNRHANEIVRDPSHTPKGERDREFDSVNTVPDANLVEPWSLSKLLLASDRFGLTMKFATAALLLLAVSIGVLFYKPFGGWPQASKGNEIASPLIHQLKSKDLERLSLDTIEKGESYWVPIDPTEFYWQVLFFDAKEVRLLKAGEPTKVEFQVDTGEISAAGFCYVVCVSSKVPLPDLSTSLATKLNAYASTLQSVEFADAKGERKEDQFKRIIRECYNDSMPFSVSVRSLYCIDDGQDIAKEK